MTLDASDVSSSDLASQREVAAKVFRAWQEFIRIEELASVTIEARDQAEADEDDHAAIVEDGISLVGDNLWIDETVFKKLRQEYLEMKKQGNDGDFQIAVSFPKIYVIEENIRKFHPLFTLDISSIFAGKYQGMGWNLMTEFIFQPTLPNLIEFMDLDEEEAEQLVIREEFRVFLESTFKFKFKTLHSFVNLVNLPSLLTRLQPIPYLVRFHYVPYSRNLKKDYGKIVEQNRWDWFVPGNPAYEYLFGCPQRLNSRTLFYGAFPTKPPTDSQALVLKHNHSNPLTAAIGPPGSGKTTLLSHPIALAVVERAMRLAQTGEDRNNLTLMTSTNNRAVQNLELLLVEQFVGESFYLSGGSRDRIEKQALPQIQAAIAWLRETDFDQREQQLDAEQLLKGVDELNKYLQQAKLQEQQQLTDLQLLEQLKGDINAIIEVQQFTQTDSSPQVFSHHSDYSQFPLVEYQRLQQLFSQTWNLLSQPKVAVPRQRHWLARFWRQLNRLWQRITRTTDRDRRQQLYEKIEQAASATHNTPFPFQFQLPLTPDTLTEYRSQIATLIQTATEQYSQSQQQSRIQTYLDQKAQVEQRLADYPEKEFYDRFYIEHHDLQQELFHRSRRYLQQVALDRKERVITSLETYRAVLLGDYDARRNLARNWQTIYRDLSLVFPVITSTLHSIRNLFPFPDSGCIHQVLADEAGTTTIHQLFPVLIRANKAIIVGDPFQLEPVMSFSEKTLDEYRQKAFLAQGLTEDDYDKYSPTAIYTASAYLRAAGASGQKGDLGSGIMLREHFRCPSPIALFFDRLCNYGLIIKTEPMTPILGTHLIANHVEGTWKNYINAPEIEAVIAWVEQLYALGYSFKATDPKKSIGVISPYRKQADALRKAIQKHWKNCTKEDVSTVHTFQGGQKAIILFSTRQCRQTDTLLFFNRRPNLLNVAVSRTQETFILVGNLNKLEQEGYTQELVRHIRQYGELRTTPPRQLKL